MKKKNWVKILNILLFQWLFIRLIKHTLNEPVIGFSSEDFEIKDEKGRLLIPNKDYKIHEKSPGNYVIESNNITTGTVMVNGDLDNQLNNKFTLYCNNKITRYSLQLWVLPLTGWWFKFIYLSKKPKLLKLR